MTYPWHQLLGLGCFVIDFQAGVVGLCVGFDVGLRVVGFDVGLCVGFDVGLRVVGFDVALRVGMGVGGFDVGLRVVGLAVVGMLVMGTSVPPPQTQQAMFGVNPA